MKAYPEVKRLRAMAMRLAAKQGTVTSDDLRSRIERNDRGMGPIFPPAYSQVFRGQGWVRVGWTRSKYHPHMIGEWARAAA